MPQVFVAALATGIGAGIAAPGAAFAWGAFFASFLVTGLSSGLLYLLNKPKQSGGSRELISRTVRSASMPKRYIYGDPVCSGLLAFAGTPYSSARKHIIYIVIVFASHKVKKIGEIFFNDKSARDPETAYRKTTDNWIKAETDWVSGTTYAPGSFVKYSCFDFGEEETEAVWRKLDDKGTTTLPPPDDAEHWEEVGWWYSIRRYNGNVDDNNEFILDEPYRMLGKDWNHDLKDGINITMAKNTYLEEGLGYIEDKSSEGLIWDDSMQFKGLAYAVIKLRFNAAMKTFPNGIPDIKARLKGFDDIYDPVTGETGYTKNPVLCAAHYICSPHGLNRGFDKTYAYDGDTHVPANDLVDWDTVKEESSHCDVKILSDHYGKAVNSENISLSSGVLWHNTDVDFLNQPWFKVFCVRKKKAGVTISNGIIPENCDYPRIKIKTVNAGVTNYYIGCIREVTKDTLSLDLNSSTPRVGKVSADNDWEWSGETSGSIDPYTTLTGIVDYVIYMEDSVRKRYELSGVVCADEKPLTVINQMALTMAGNVTWINGKYRILAGQYRSPVAIIQERDFQTPLTVVPLHSRKDVYNIIRGTVIDKINSDQKIDFPEVTKQEYIDEDDGLTYYNTLDFAYVDNQGQAQRISQIALNKFRSEITVGGTGKFTLFPLGVTENVQLESYTLFPAETDNRKIFCISSWELSPPKKDSAGGIVLSLTEDKPENYAVDIFNQTSINCTTELVGVYDSLSSIDKDPVISYIHGQLMLRDRGNSNEGYHSASVTFLLSDFDRHQDIMFYCEIDYSNLESLPINIYSPSSPYTVSVDTEGRYLQIVKTGFTFPKNTIKVINTGLGLYEVTKVRYRDAETNKLYIGFVKEVDTVTPSKVYVYKDVTTKQPGWQVEIPYDGDETKIEFFTAYVDVLTVMFETHSTAGSLYSWQLDPPKLSSYVKFYDGITRLWVSGCYKYKSYSGDLYIGNYIQQVGDAMQKVSGFTSTVFPSAKSINGVLCRAINLQWDAPSTNYVEGIRIIFSTTVSTWSEQPSSAPYNSFIADISTGNFVWFVDVGNNASSITVNIRESDYSATAGLFLAKAFYTAAEYTNWSEDPAVTGINKPANSKIVSGINQKPVMFTYNSVVSLEPEILYFGENDQFDSFINEFDISECYTTISYSPGTVRLWINGIEMYPYIVNKTTGESGVADTWEFKEDDLVNYIKLTTKSPIPAGSKCLISYKAKQYATV